MSEENVEIVRRSFEEFNRSGYLPEELFHADVELTNLRESPIPGPYRGHDGLRRWRDDLLEVLEEGRFELEDLVDVGENVVVTRLRLRGRAKHTRIEIEYPFSVISRLRDGRVYRSDAISDHAEALEAARLSE